MVAWRPYASWSHWHGPQHHGLCHQVAGRSKQSWVLFPIISWNQAFPVHTHLVVSASTCWLLLRCWLIMERFGVGEMGYNRSSLRFNDMLEVRILFTIRAFVSFLKHCQIRPWQKLEVQSQRIINSHLFPIIHKKGVNLGLNTGSLNSELLTFPSFWKSVIPYVAQWV